MLGVTPEFWANRRVLVTGHTGFKGAWLSLWLAELGAKVSGLALAPEGEPNLWALLQPLAATSYTADINDQDAVANCIAQEKPDTVFHLAAQSLVRRSYSDPVETFATNVLGVVKLLNAVRRAPSVKSCVIVTSDKCYQNDETGKIFGENDPMGGLDPYSASKGAAELATQAMRHSYFSSDPTVGRQVGVATARAGNVVGGGDWSEDRLIPDIVRGCLGPQRAVVIRSPKSVRPWQHVLEPLRGYMLLAEHLESDLPGADSGWNFGPDKNDVHPVLDVAGAIVAALGQGTIDIREDTTNPHEAGTLQIDSSKALSIGWRPRLDFEQTIAMTADWYGKWHSGVSARKLCLQQINQYTKLSG